MEDCPIIRERLRKAIGQTIKRYLEVNGQALDLVHDIGLYGID